MRGGLVAVKLRAVQAQLVDPALDLVDRRVDEHADLEHAGRNRGQHVARRRRLDEALRPRPQVHADRVRAGGHRQRRVLRRRDAADLDEEARTR